MPLKLKPALAVLATSLVAAAPAQAVFVPAESVDGPTADITSFGEVSVAPDGTGALVYIKGGDVYAATLENGVWSAPAEVAANFGANTANPRVAAANGGRAIVVFEDNEAGAQAIIGSVRPGAGQAFGAGFEIETSAAVSLDDPDVDVNANGVGYVIWKGNDGANTTVRVGRVDGGSVTAIPGKLNSDGSDGAGGVIAPNMAIAADAAGNGVAFYNENTGGNNTTYVRRLSGTTVGAPIQWNVATFLGLPEAPGATNGTMLDIDIADDGSAWAVGRQDITDGGNTDARGIGRRLVGDAFGDPVAIDQTVFGSATDDGGERPQVDLNGAGNGLVAADRQLTDGGDAGLIGPGGPSAFVPIGGGTVNAPQPAFGGNGTGTVGYQVDTTFAAIRWNGSAFEPPQTISAAGLGDVGGVSGLAPNSSATSQGDVAFAFIQGAAANTRIVAGSFDAPPSAPVGTTSERPRRDRTPSLAWDAATDLWGGVQSYAVSIDGNQVGTTPGTSFTAPRLSNGNHTWTVTATDRRGQTATSAPRKLVIDTKKPTAKLKIRGKKRVGKKVKFVVTARDASGIARVQIKFGDKKKATKRKLRKRKASFSHRYKRAKTYKVKVTVTDKAGNKKVIRKKLRIRP